MRRIRVVDRRQRDRHRRRPHVHRRAPRASRRGGRSGTAVAGSIMDVTRFAQFGTLGGRDHATTGRPSRSTRRACTAPRTAAGASAGVGSPDPGSRRTPPGSTQAFFLWAPIHWDDRCTHFGVFEDADANRWHTDGAVAARVRVARRHPRREDPDLELLAGVEHELDYLPGHAARRHARIALVARRRSARATSTSSRSSASA